MKNTFPYRLKELRIENNLSRKQLAEKLFVTQRTISYWENGKRECDFNMLIKISNCLNCTIDYLLGKDEL